MLEIGGNNNIDWHCTSNPEQTTFVRIIEIHLPKDIDCTIWALSLFCIRFMCGSLFSKSENLIKLARLSVYVKENIHCRAVGFGFVMALSLHKKILQRQTFVRY